MAALFEKLGFRPVAKHRSKAVTLFRQGDVNFILNDEPDSHAARFADVHGPCACAKALRVADAGQAYEHALAQGVRGVPSQTGPMELNIPAVEGIGGALVYLVDRYGEGDIYEIDFRPIDGADARPAGYGLAYIDHLTHNVYQGNMAEWAGYYGRLFNFREVRFFDIEGKLTGLLIPGELKKNSGFVHGKPPSAFSPVAVTLAALGDAWDGAKLHGRVIVDHNGERFGQPDAGQDMYFDFPALIAHAAKTRPLSAGTIIGSGTISNRNPDAGSCCLAERRTIETIADGKPIA
jgi:hypothetical protein